MKNVLISLITSKSNDSFTFKSLIIECILFNNNISYLLKLLINIKVVNYFFINKLTVQFICN